MLRRPPTAGRALLAVLVGALTAAVLIVAPGALSRPAAQEAEGTEPSVERAESLVRGGQVERAAEMFARVAEADPEDASSRAGRVRCLLALDRWREALAEATRFSAQLPSSPVVATVLGEALLRAGRFEEADAVLSPVVSALRLPDRGGVPGATLARALLALGRLRAAEGSAPVAYEYLNRAAALAPDDPTVVYESAGAAPDRAAIVARLERYLELGAGEDPDRIEAARGKIRFYEALADRAVWVVEDLPERIEVPLRAVGDGFGGVLGYTVDVALGPKKPVTLMLDSGSTGLFVLERIARKRGFEPLAVETVFGGGGDRRHESPRGLFPDLAIGGLRFSGALAATTTHEIDPTGRFHGLLGLSAFDGYHITLDLVAPRMILDRTVAEQTAGGPYWEVSGQLLVRATTSAGDGGLFLLDTGATRTCVSLDLAERSPAARIGRPVQVEGYGGTLAGARVVYGLSVELDGRATPGTTVNATDLTVQSRLGGVEISGQVGLDLLAGRRIAIDTRSRRVAIAEVERRRPQDADGSEDKNKGGPES